MSKPKARRARIGPAAQLRVIGFTGNAGAGKTTAARYLVDRVRKAPVTAMVPAANFAEAFLAGQAHLQRASAEVLSLATPLKEVCFKIYNRAPREAFYGSQEEKEAPLEAYPGWTGRRILQHIGTEGFRSVCSDIWVQVMRANLEARTGLIVIDDIRFVNEAAGLADIAEIYRINRPGLATGTHASELEIAHIPVVGEINNDEEGLETFYAKLDRVLP